MPLIDITKNLDALTMSVNTRFDAPVDRVWQLWADPRQLERWWGPPSYPATFVEHDLRAGGDAAYYMTGPEGEQPRGWWKFHEVTAPRHIELEDGFADEQGAPVEDGPTTVMTVTIEASVRGGAGDAGDGRPSTTMTITSVFPSLESMQQLLDMGMSEGLGEAIGQIDAILAE